MRIRHSSLALVLAAATLITGCGEKSTPRGWDPDEALQRADKAVGKNSDAETRVTMRGTGFLAAGLDKTLQTDGERPYRFDIACDSEQTSRLTLVLSRDGLPSDRSFEVGCAAGDVTRINVPAGAPLSVHIEAAPKDDSPPAGVIAWQLLTLDPANVQGCANDLAGCSG